MPPKTARKYLNHGVTVESPRTDQMQALSLLPAVMVQQVGAALANQECK